MYQLLLGACARRARPAVSAPAPERTDTSVRGPYRVAIRGYAGDAMEPFMTRDARWLLFNTRNGKSVTRPTCRSPARSTTAPYGNPFAAAAVLKAGHASLSAPSPVFSPSEHRYASNAGTIEPLTP